MRALAEQLSHLFLNLSNGLKLKLKVEPRREGEKGQVIRMGDAQTESRALCV